jgi:hypothetical protein
MVGSSGSALCASARSAWGTEEMGITWKRGWGCVGTA